MAGLILGAAVKRVEDPRLITGRGRYLGNLDFPDALHLKVVRSPVAHGRIVEVDVAAARSMPGVVAVLTAADIDLEPMPPGVPGVDPRAARPILAGDRVRFVGEPVAAVVAVSARRAADAAATVWVDIEPLPVVATVAAATAEGAPLLFPELGTNVVVSRDLAVEDDVLADADVVVTADFRNQRLAAVPLEGAAAVAVPHDDGSLELWASSQNVFLHRRAVAAALKMDQRRLRVRVPDMGGGFGAKIQTAPEQVLTAAAARLLGRTVCWHETRTENLIGMTQGRAQEQHIELGATTDGRLVGVRIRLLQDGGAYPVFGSYLPWFTELMASGPYAIPRVDIAWRTALTNTTPIHAYRGAGRPEATSMLERAMDLLAARLGTDPVELRRRNLLSDDAFPYTTPTGAVYDSGEYSRALDRALDLTDYEGLRAEQAARRAGSAERLLGIGVATYVEVTAAEPRSEWGRATVEADGSIVIRTGISSHGQGHETAYTQLAAELFRVPLEVIRVIQGDTGEVARGGGTMGSRSLQLGGSAVLRAGEAVVVMARRLTAHLAEAAFEDIVVFDGGRVGVAGVPDSGYTWAELAVLADDPANLCDGMSPGLSAETVFEQDDSTYPFGTHVSVVEVDTTTGEVIVLAHIAVDDCGTILNRMLVDGQVHGGIAQGIGQALLEEVRFDEAGNPLTGNLTTYLLPTAGMVPDFTVAHTITPSPLNPLGAKGIGEAATIGSTPAIHNAVLDALRPLGIDHIDMPLTAGRVWEALNSQVGGRARS